MIVVRATLTNDTVNLPLLPNVYKEEPVPVLLLLPEFAVTVEGRQLDAPPWAWSSDEVDDVYLGD